MYSVPREASYDAYLAFTSLQGTTTHSLVVSYDGLIDAWTNWLPSSVLVLVHCPNGFAALLASFGLIKSSLWTLLEKVTRALMFAFNVTFLPSKPKNGGDFTYTSKYSGIFFSSSAHKEARFTSITLLLDHFFFGPFKFQVLSPILSLIRGQFSESIVQSNFKPSKPATNPLWNIRECHQEMTSKTLKPINIYKKMKGKEAKTILLQTPSTSSKPALKDTERPSSCAFPETHHPNLGGKKKVIWAKVQDGPGALVSILLSKMYFFLLKKWLEFCVLELVYKLVLSLVGWSEFPLLNVLSKEQLPGHL